MRRQINFVDDQQIGTGNTWTAFAGDFVAAGDINDVDGGINEFPG